MADTENDIVSKRVNGSIRFDTRVSKQAAYEFITQWPPDVISEMPVQEDPCRRLPEPGR